MFIKPMNIVGIQCYLNFGNEEKEIAEKLNRKFGFKIDSKLLNISFSDFYKAHVFTNMDILRQLAPNIDVILFCSDPGAGHFAAAYAEANELEKRGYNVIIVDLIRILAPVQADLSTNSWLYVSRKNQLLFLFFYNLIKNQAMVELLYGSLKKVDLTDFGDFLKSKNVKLCLSNFLFPNVISSKFSQYVDNFGIVLTDHSVSGMLCELYHDLSKTTVLVPDDKVIQDANLYYPYTRKLKEVVNIEGVPSLMSSSNIKKLKADLGSEKAEGLLTYFVGGGLGIGYGIKAVETVMKAHNGITVIVCGDNPKWVEEAKSVAQKYPEKKIFVLGYVAPQIAIQLIYKSDVVISKAGGITSSEVTSIEGKKAFYGSILGHESNQAEIFNDSHLVINCYTEKELYDFIMSPLETESIFYNYSKKSPVEKLGDWVYSKLK